MDITFIDSCGKTRQGIMVFCKSCQQEFVTRKTSPATYCSVACRGKGRRNSVEQICQHCDKKFERSKSHACLGKHGIVFCSRACKDAGQTYIKEIMPPHYGTSKERNPQHYRNCYRRFHNVEKLSCQRCGYDEFECGIDIHHLNGDWRDNTEKNLISLCAPCHRALHLKLWSVTD
jgi:hypothetical protein